MGSVVSFYEQEHEHEHVLRLGNVVKGLIRCVGEKGQLAAVVAVVDDVQRDAVLKC